MKKLSLLIRIVLLEVVFLFAIPSHAQAVTQDPACVNVGGTCQSTTSTCSQPYLSGYCPSSGSTIKCCAPKYSISGTVCYDTSGNGNCDAGEGVSGVTVSNSNGAPPITTTSSGQYSFGGLYSYPTTGYPYGISVSNLPATYTAPNSPALLYLEHQNRTVNFVIVSPTPTNTPTPTPTNTPTPTPTPKPFTQSTTTPGIIFTGNNTPNFGIRDLAASSIKRWVVGGLTYPEVFPTSTTTSTVSYQYLLNKAIASQVTVNDITEFGCPSLTDCDLPSTLTRGVYRANGNLTLNTHTFLPNNNYIFLINGNLTLQGNITIPNNSTVLFAARDDIIVPETVGAASNSYPLPQGQIQGLFSAGKNFRIEGIKNCITGPDKMLNIEGSIVTNAGGSGGSLINDRDLCSANLTIPSFTVRGRMDFLFNLPEFVMQHRKTFKEIAP